MSAAGPGGAGARSTATETVPRPIVVPVHYDFASSLCYVAHRVMGRIAHRFAFSPSDPERPPIELRWSPVDLAGLLNWRRGGLVPEERRANVLRVARELGVSVRVPPRWLDSRRAMAAAIALETQDGEREGAGAAWRERVLTAIFEEGRDCGLPEEVLRWARDLGLAFDEATLARGEDELEQRTRSAAEAMVSGVPSFMLGEWPMGGIQDDETMVSLIHRFARRARARGAL